MNPKNSNNKKSNQTKNHFKKLINFFLNLLGKKTKKSFSLVISHLTDSYEKEGLISSEEKKMFRNIASFDDKKVSNIMTPRSDIIAVKENATLEEVKKIITNDGHTRIPVYKDTFDHIIGFIHSKDLAKFLCGEDKDFSLSKIMRKILFVPRSMKLLNVLLRMRTARVHIGIVLDEFGGVDGIVTIENLMEEIVGEIEDEHDIPLESDFFQIKQINEKTFQFGGRVGIDKFEEILKVKIISDDEFQTVGGLVMSAFKNVPKAGEVIEKFNIKFKIIVADARVVKVVEATAN